LPYTASNIGEKNLFFVFNIASYDDNRLKKYTTVMSLTWIPLQDSARHFDSTRVYITSMIPYIFWCLTANQQFASFLYRTNYIHTQDDT